MIGMSIGEFMDKIYYGDEIEFQYNRTTYFVQGNYVDGKYTLTVDYWNAADGTEPEHEYLLVLECSSAEERMQRFEEAKIFEGKGIYEIESAVKVQFG